MLGNVGPCWEICAVFEVFRRVGKLWLVLGNVGACWEMLGRVGKYWLLSGNAGSCWQMLGRVGNVRLVLGNFVVTENGGPCWEIWVSNLRVLMMWSATFAHVE